ncbi:hypothetical protein FA13DRAFT_1444760 [Coprinellus micaceus]|uniref:Uncharacterized protein n=1 Tax=Coprinellus micaceus TaxID=71717 RepID=A0A4Y7TNN3_COPMI|nr:hypothetical protein FA13DRAFT_1444760 [Coprinellus micaceus]
MHKLPRNSPQIRLAQPSRQFPSPTPTLLNPTAHLCLPRSLLLNRCHRKNMTSQAGRTPQPTSSGSAVTVSAHPPRLR